MHISAQCESQKEMVVFFYLYVEFNSASVTLKSKDSQISIIDLIRSNLNVYKDMPAIFVCSYTRRIIRPTIDSITLSLR